MKTSKRKEVRVAELKARLSHYLRAVNDGDRYTVFDRTRPIAELSPVASTKPSAWEQWVASGVVAEATASFSSVVISPLTKKVDTQKLLDFVRGD